MLSSLESFPFHLHSYFSFGKTRQRSTNLLSAAQLPAAEAGAHLPQGCPLRQPRLTSRCPNPPSQGAALHSLGLPEIAAGGGRLPARITRASVWSWCSKKRCRDQTQGWRSCTMMLVCHPCGHARADTAQLLFYQLSALSSFSLTIAALRFHAPMGRSGRLRVYLAKHRLQRRAPAGGRERFAVMQLGS